MKKDILRSSFFRVLEIVIVTIVSLALTPYLIKHLGDEHYGLWLLILSTLGWFNFIDLGFSSAVKREIAIALEKNKMQRINVVFSVSVVLFGSLGVVAALGILGIASFPEIIGVEGDKRAITTLALSLLALKVLFDFIMNSFHGFFAAYIRLDIDANLSLLNTLIKSGLVFILIVDMNILGAVVATLVADVITQCLKMYFARRLNKGFVFSLSFVNFAEIKHLFSYSKHVIATGIAKTIQDRSDPLIVSHFLGLKFVALYGVVLTLANQVEALVRSIVESFGPVFNRLVAREGDVEDVFTQVININFFVVLCFYSALAILAEDFIYLWIGEEYSKYSDLAAILGFGFLCRSVSRPVTSILMAQANHKLISVVKLVGAIINILLSIVFVRIWGVFGIAFATAISFLTSDIVLHLILLKRHNDFKLKTTLIKILTLLSAYCTFVWLGLSILSRVAPLSWLELIGASALVFSFVCVFSWFVFLTQPLRVLLLNTVIKRV